MTLDCKDANKFLERLFGFLSDSGLCFLSGSLVIDDDDHKLFKSLYEGKSSEVCENIYKKKRPLGTHLNFLDKDLFKSRGGYVLKTLNPKRQFEKILSPKISYICDSHCRFNESEDCIVNKASKGVLLFYPFEIHNVKTIPYIFLKLEGYVHDDTKHMTAAVGRYILKKEKKDKYAKRREDDVMNEELFMDDEKLIIKYINTYYSNIIEKGLLRDLISIISQKISFYNNYVRSSNELYLPSEILILLRISFS